MQKWKYPNFRGKLYFFLEICWKHDTSLQSLDIILVLFTVLFSHFLFLIYLVLAERHFLSDILVSFPDSGDLYSREKYTSSSRNSAVSQSFTVPASLPCSAKPLLSTAFPPTLIEEPSANSSVCQTLNPDDRTMNE